VLLQRPVFGPPIEYIQGGVKGLHYSTRIIYSLFDGENATVPATTFPSYIDVRDLATAHVRALTEPKVANKRCNVGGLPVTYTAMAHALAKVPELKGRVSADSGEDKNVTPAHIEAQWTNEALGLKLHTLEETMADAAKRILELEKQ
jgi:nucleoside-diphosphate-sugar epimerase